MALCADQFHVNELLRNRHYYDEKSGYLKTQIAVIEKEMTQHIESDIETKESVETILGNLDCNEIESEMIRVDTALKLKVRTICWIL